MARVRTSQSHGMSKVGVNRPGFGALDAGYLRNGLGGLRASDATIMSAIAGGDARALDELYARYSRTLLTIARSMLATVEDAEEVVGDVFIRVWSKPTNYDGARGSVAGWLITVCRSRALEVLRKGRRRSKLLEESFDPLELGIGMSAHYSAEAGSVGALADRAALTRCLDHLSDSQRAAIELAYLDGLSHAQIAAQLSIPVGTVKTRVRAGLSILRRHVQMLQ